MKIESVNVQVQGLYHPVRIALVADLHSRPCGELLAALQNDPPDMIAAVGDMMHNPWRVTDPAHTVEHDREAYHFFEEAVRLAPVFYSLGNHELRIPQAAREAVQATGVWLLDNEAVAWKDLWIGGLTSAGHGRIPTEVPPPDLAWLREFHALPGPRVLLCHHPEYYPRYIRETGVDVVLSGHAHGGQWRFFGQGIYAPGQGLFPKYTSGVYEDRLVVSRGLANTARIPRFGNPTELVYVQLVG